MSQQPMQNETYRQWLSLPAKNSEEVQRMRRQVEQYNADQIPQRLAESTQGAYDGHWKRWLECCHEMGFEWNEWNRYTVEMFIGWRRVRGRKWDGRPCKGSTISSNLSGIRAKLIELGERDVLPFSAIMMPRASMLLTAIKMHDEVDKKYPLTDEMLIAMARTLDLGKHDARVMVFYLAISHNTIRRANEVLCHGLGGMMAGDIVWQNGTYVPKLGELRDRTASYNFSRSKTNRNGRLQTAFMWCRCPGICALCSLRELYAGSPWPMERTTRLLRFEDGEVLDYKTALELVKKLVERIGGDPKKYGTHSLRSGGCQDALRMGLSDLLINSQAYWAGNRSRRGYEGNTMLEVNALKLQELALSGHNSKE